MKRAIKTVLNNLLFLFVVVCLLNLLILYFLRSDERTPLREAASSQAPGQAATLSGFFDGSFQKRWEAWFSENFPGHADAVRLHNQIEYSVFCDGVGGWLQGKDGYLFSSGTEYADGPFALVGQQSDYDEYAQKVFALQTNLEKLGKDFVYLLTPTKAEIYPDKLPWNERLIAGRYASGGRTLRDAMTDAFERFGVHYYDMTPDIRRMRESDPEFDVFTTTGHHWTLTAVAHEINALFEAIRPMTPHMTYPKIAVNGLFERLFEVDEDIIRSFNVSNRKLTRPYQMPEIAYERQTGESVYLFGTSMSLEIANALFTSASQRAFDRLVYAHYFTTTTTYDENGVNARSFNRDTKPEEENVMQHIKESDLVIMESQALSELPDTHVRFLDYVNGNIDKIDRYNLKDNLVRYTQDLSGAQLEGFYDLESWGRWTCGRTCSFTLNGRAMKEIAGDARIRMRLKSYEVDQDVGVVFNGERLATLRVTPEIASYAVTAPQALIEEDENVIQLTIDGHVYTPKELGLMDEARYYGLGVESLTVEAGD